MNDKQAEMTITQQRLLDGMGFQSLEHFEEFKSNAINGSVECQDQFIQGIGTALHYADLKRSIRLVWAFKEDFDFAAMAWRMAEAKRKATSES